jgi:argininosuccinate synthase
MTEKIVLAYSGGLDTSVAAKWLQEARGYEVHCLTIDLGNLPDVDGARERGLSAGALSVDVVDAKEDFLNYFVFPALQANALYQGEYPLATALGRPLIGKLLVDKARELGATAVAHGCTGKGNDQVRLDIAIGTLAPDLTIVGTARENEMSRDAAIAYAQRHGIAVRQTLASPYSTDENLWGRSVECGELEDPWAEPPSDVWAWTREIDDTPPKAATIEVGFEEGIPVSLDGEQLDPVALVQQLSKLGGEHGIARCTRPRRR